MKQDIHQLSLFFISACEAAAKKYANERTSEFVLLQYLFGGHCGHKPTELVNARDEVVMELVDKGASEPLLGRWLNVDHTTVHYIKKRELEKRSHIAVETSVANVDATQ